MRMRFLQVLTAAALTGAAVGCSEEGNPPTAPVSDRMTAGIETNTLIFRQVSAGPGHACGVTTDNRAYCWGGNGSGDLGNGTIESSTSPVPVAGGHRFRAVSAGRAFTCAVTTDDEGFCWGHNPYGELGNGVTGPETCFAGIECSTIPVPVAGHLRMRQVSAGQDHACAVTTGNEIYCWGMNFFGQLGDGTAVETRLAPVPVDAHVRFGQVDAGNYHTCAVTLQHKVYCWGENSYGQLGTHGGGRDWQHAHLKPTVAAGGLKLRLVRAGYFDTCGVTTDDRAYCWGKNGPELGSVPPSNDDFERSPRLVAGGHAFTDVDPSYQHTCGVTTGGVAYCWGYLGTDRPTPVRVSGGLRFSQLSTGYYNACGVATNGRAYCWDGSLAPVEVPEPE